MRVPFPFVEVDAPRPRDDRPGCMLCGRATYDADKRATPWARAVVSGKQVLICPECQRDRPDWMDGLDRCVSCGSTRLTAILSQVVCRSCGYIRDA